MFELHPHTSLGGRALLYWSLAWRFTLVSLAIALGLGAVIGLSVLAFGWPGPAKVLLPIALVLYLLSSLPVTGFVTRAAVAANGYATPDALTLGEAFRVGLTYLAWGFVTVIPLGLLQLLLAKIHPVIGYPLGLVLGFLAFAYIILPRLVRRLRIIKEGT
jgi:hypothetical protein